MSMRKWERGVAHHRMERMGYEHVNKPRFEKDGSKVVRAPSVFAQTWKKVMTFGAPHNKEYFKIAARSGRY